MRLDRTISDELVNLGYMPELRKLYRGEGSLDIISSDGKTLYKISGDLDNPVFEAYALLPDGVVDAPVDLPPEDISLALKNQLGKGQVLGFEQAEDKMMSFAMAKKPAQSMFDSAMDTAFDSPMEVVRLQELSKAKEAAQSNVRDLAAREKMVEGRPLPPDFLPTTNRVSDEEFQAGLERVRQEGYDGSPAGGQMAMDKYTRDMGRNPLRNPEDDPRLQRMVDLGQMGALPGQEAGPPGFPLDPTKVEAFPVDEYNVPVPLVEQYNYILRGLELKKMPQEFQAIIERDLARIFGQATPEEMERIKQLGKEARAFDRRGVPIEASEQHQEFIEIVEGIRSRRAPSQLEGAAELAAQLKTPQKQGDDTGLTLGEYLTMPEPLLKLETEQFTPAPLGAQRRLDDMENFGVAPGKEALFNNYAISQSPQNITDPMAGLVPRAPAPLRPYYSGTDLYEQQKIQEAGLTTHAAGKNFLAATERGPQKTVVGPGGFVFEIDETRGGYTRIGKQKNDGTIEKMDPKYFESGSKAAQTLDQQRLDQAEAGPPSLPPPTPTNPDDRPDAYSPMFSVDKPQAEAPAVEKTPKQREKLNDAQKMGALYGTMLGLEIIGQTAAALSPARKYARQEEKRLENLAQRGQLGLTEGEKSEIRSAYARPVKAMASEARKRQESTLAATGANLSAAELARRRKEESQTVQRALSDAAATITQADMQKAQQQLAKLEGLKEYRTQAQQQAAGSIIGTVATGAKALGDVFATQARAEDPTSAIQSLAREYSMQNSEMTMDDAYKLAELEIKRRLEEDKKKQGGPTNSYGMTGAQIAGTYIGS